MKILVIFSCFNRKEKTENCIRSLVSLNSTHDISFVVVDDNSNDGTKEMIRELNQLYDIHFIESDGNLFYSGAMRLGMEYSLQNFDGDFDYVLICNDDVIFLEESVSGMICQSKEQNDAVIVGAMKNSAGDLSYGAIKYLSGTKYRLLSVAEWEIEADTFNANAVLIPYHVFESVGAFDNHFVHSLGDFDYGLCIKSFGFKIFISKFFVGICENNPKEGTWTDVNLSVVERICKKESPKGAPAKQWFYFLKKHFGACTAIKGVITPYLRILLKK